ncbi:phosphodiester glycosidase family protein [Serpentinicella alkaliphila]|uniref:Uncharacterized protein DUF2233 n=1 Tax=Serpentinicella alkaliphila TaxID=1734049 RepID=A0A4R2TFJ4_9FIRM|nr:phosphodiester glycosidase family protein [Serpentinicella alkaliphila]QUH25818.1 phosphodiester glycosidase family protein [Serpentinicella alkaliphila]TCP99834.1 uncharacterized protein DUF2233 [Serpentinicella alkaliphila]
MRRFKKALATIGIVSIIVTSSISSVFAIESVVYEKQSRQMISSGVTHKHVLRFGKDGWLNANVVYIDLDNPSMNLDILQSANGITTKETLSTMVNRNQNVVAAINADFFYLTTPDSPMGAMIKDGEMISSPIFVENFATLSINKNNEAYADYLKCEIYVSTDKGNSIPVTTINKYTHEYQGIMLIDSNWGASTPGYNPKHYDMVEIVVIGDTVTEVRRQQPSTLIPQNGYVLLSSQDNARVLFDNIKVGDNLKVNTNISPFVLEDIKLAIGGGTVLVKNGQPFTFTQSITGNHPRTAVGITKDRKKLIMVTVDGRHSSFVGVDGKRLADLMIELGSHEAILMDGGGSTTMMARGLGNSHAELVNIPSDGGERRIVNGLAVVSQSIQTELNGITTAISEDKGFVGTSREILVKAFDTNYNPLAVNQKELRFLIKKGEGFFQGNRFIPTRAGETIIEVDYLGKKSEVKLKVLEEVRLLQISPGSIALSPGGNATPKVIGVDKNGYSATISTGDLSWKDEKGLGTFINGVYTAGEKSGTTTLIATFKNQTATVPVVIASNKISLGGLDKYNYKFTSFPATVTGSVSKDTNTKVGQHSLKLEYDFTQTDGTRAAYIEFEGGNVILPSNPTKIGLWVFSYENTPGWIRGNVKDASGTRYTIDFKRGIDWIGWQYLEANLPQNILSTVELERIYVVETDSNNKVGGKLLFDGLDVTYGTQSTAVIEQRGLEDYLNVPYEAKGTQFFVHSGVIYSEAMSQINAETTEKLKTAINNNYDVAIFTDNLKSDIVSGLNKPTVIASRGYEMREYEDNLIIYLDSRSGGLRNTDFSQWPWLMNLLKTNNKKNVFVILPGPISGFTDQLEAKLLRQTLTDAAEKDKNVFVLQNGGQSVQPELLDGVRYISTGMYNNTTGRSSKYVLFNILNNQVTYQIKDITE